ncbi:hypothetical protein LTR84_012676 [Exophiala bonariae]|uniref:Uncharacterized protein n=1 Tax=Exophiala bonariae TaxID=1690606 RepID=A0AAV9NFX4_9EURO|nr:hypothetical protein LTR84_012676 [Exophiala bonariae]
MSDLTTCFVSSFYDFSQPGINNFIRDFKDSHEDPDSAPFLSYDQETRSFVLEFHGDSEDKVNVVSQLLYRLDGYIEYNHNRVTGFDEGVPCLPVPGIFLDDDEFMDEEVQTRDLIEYDSGGEAGEAGEEEVVEAAGLFIVDWKPQHGDINILPRMYANEISRLTGTDLFVKLAEKRYGLMNGDVQLALQKLSNVEPLLESIKRSMMSESIMANSNLLIWPVDVDEAAIELVRLHPGHPGFSRIIVNQADPGTLQRKLLGEIRHHVSGTTYLTPQNLEGVSPVEEIHGSKIWDGHTFMSFGNPSSLQPIITSTSDHGRKEDKPVAKPQNSNDIRVSEWSNQVVPSADPNVAPEAPPIEVATPVRRRVLLDSDSESDGEDGAIISRPSTLQPLVKHSLPAAEMSNEINARSDASLISFSEVGSRHESHGIPSMNHDGSVHSSNHHRPQNKKAKEEHPRLHSTMNQKGRNPGRGGNKQQETKAQRKERLAKAMADAHGDFPAARSSQSRPVPVLPSMEKSNEAISKAKQASLMKKPSLAKDSSQLAELERKLRYVQAKKLIEQLTPLFEISRRFSGRLSFEAQFGQVLIPQTHKLIDQPLHTQESWTAVFGPQNPTPSPCTFTKIVTMNGADIDRALETKLPTGLDGLNKTIKVWSASPGPVGVTYQFSCHSRSSEDFVIAIDQTGQYQLHKGAITAGMVNVHIPSQVWDASFVLTGSLTWIDPPEILVNSVKTFRDSLYVLPGRSKLIMVFRQPSDHEIEIRNLVVRRVSLHQCNLPGYEEMQMKVTEVKSLLFKKHPQDNNLWQAYEKSDEHSKLMRQGRIHYELSIIHKGINATLMENEYLEIGELTKTTPESLLDQLSIQSMLDLTVKMVSKLDYMGMSNIGTLYRIQQEAEEQRRNLGQLLGTAAPPGSVLPTAQPTQKRSGTSPSRETPVSMELMPQGVRVNTVAEIFTGPDGMKYMRGLGGAKMPVPDAHVGNDDDSIAPEDSATQVGAQIPHIPPPAMPSVPRFPVIAPGFPPLVPTPSSPVGENPTPSIGSGSTVNPQIQFYTTTPSVSQRGQDSRETGFW